MQLQMQIHLNTVIANAGWLWAKGALDFAGGTVVHINAGIAGLVACMVLVNVLVTVKKL